MSGQSLIFLDLKPKVLHHEKMSKKWPPFWRRSGPTAPQRRAMISMSTPLNRPDQEHQYDTLVCGIVHGKMSKLQALMRSEIAHATQM